VHWRSLRELLDSGPVTFNAYGKDSDGRTLAYVYAGKVDVARKLLEEGHALIWHPGTIDNAKRLGAWCP
jgi:endonuclease YncB( thermonuclease family)